MHHGLVHALVREDVLASRVEHLERRVRHDRREVLVVDGVDVGWVGANADRSETQRLTRLDDAVDVLAPAGADRRFDRGRAAAGVQDLLRRPPLVPATAVAGRRLELGANPPVPFRLGGGLRRLRDHGGRTFFRGVPGHSGSWSARRLALARASWSWHVCRSCGVSRWTMTGRRGSSESRARDPPADTAW